MADFCKQCSVEMFGEDTRDLAGSPPDAYKRLHTICEGCGFTVVDYDGVCLGKCLRNHGTEPVQTPQQFHKGELPT